MPDEDHIVLRYVPGAIYHCNQITRIKQLQNFLNYNLQKMSITISNCDEICHAPTNQSPAKMLYTFPKQPRFLKRRTILCDRFYELKSTFSTRGAGFGYGKKYDFTKEASNSPPPNSYCINDEFSPNVSKKKGFIFGESREKMALTGPLVETVKNKNPAPNNYEIKPIRSKISYSLSAKNNIEDKEKLNIPGPGEYPVTFTLNKDGKYFTAKYKNSCVRDFGKVLGRCQTAENKIPGPGAYDVSALQDISPKGKYALSNLQNCLTRSFGHSKRGELLEDKKTPGPGNYKLPSEFGYYVSRSSYLQEHKQNVSPKSPKTKESEA